MKELHNRDECDLGVFVVILFFVFRGVGRTTRISLTFLDGKSTAHVVPSNYTSLSTTELS